MSTSTSENASIVQTLFDLLFIFYEWKENWTVHRLRDLPVLS